MQYLVNILCIKLKSCFLFSIDIKSIRAHLELGQLFNYEGNNDIFAHVDSEFDDQNLLDTLKNEASSGLNVRDASSKILPPSSIQSTLKASDRKTPGKYFLSFEFFKANGE